ncbi:transcriptional regulator [Zoogloea sp.]|uniref:helix-turn-helix domain-containing protein n=1 Tax=Zoogloea sp. TaxID=49181 RepID=UPI00260CB17A|nr:transcriptional regulator [Zoogloea sp.]MDD3355069.1 transcriptional regulator [Zoogloea sp.]
MELKPIRTEAEHAEALADIERLWDAPEGSADADRLEVLAMLVEAYEKAHFPIEAPDPISFLEYVMDVRGLTRKDLERYIGPRGRVADIMNRTRPLSVTMIRRLCSGLGLPADVLIQPYGLREPIAA